jgi:hypothetical protein
MLYRPRPFIRGRESALSPAASLTESKLNGHERELLILKCRFAILEQNRRESASPIGGQLLQNSTGLQKSRDHLQDRVNHLELQ